MAHDLFDCVDHRRFLSLAQERSGLTGRELAKRVGRSAPWLSLMLSGMRELDPSLVATFCEALDLDEEESGHLAALVDIASPSARARRSGWAAVMGRRQQHAAENVRDDLTRMYKHWWIIAVGELACCDGFRADPEWIANTLVPPITEAQAAKALTTLIDLGVLKPDDQGRVRPNPDEVTWTSSLIPPGELAHMMARWQGTILDLAAKSIYEFSHTERLNSVTTFTMSEEQMPAVLARLREVERELVLLCHEGGEQPNRVYTAAIQLFPLSNFTDCEPPADES